MSRRSKKKTEQESPVLLPDHVEDRSGRSLAEEAGKDRFWLYSPVGRNGQAIPVAQLTVNRVDLANSVNLHRFLIRVPSRDELASSERIGLAPVSWTGTDLGFKHSAAAVSSRS